MRTTPGRATGPTLGHRGAKRRTAMLDEAIAFQQATVGDWPVVEGRVTDKDRRHFFAFVREDEGVFDLGPVDRADRWSRFASMRAAFTHLARTGGR